MGTVEGLSSRDRRHLRGSSLSYRGGVSATFDENRTWCRALVWWQCCSWRSVRSCADADRREMTSHFATWNEVAGQLRCAKRWQAGPVSVVSSNRHDQHDP